MPIEDVIQEVMTIFEGIAKERQITLEYQKPEQKLPQILIDNTRIKSALIKIVDNALWYTRKQGKVTISTNYNKDQDTISIKVQDTGIGLTEEDKQLLFKKFSRGRGSLGMNVNSSGLSLYIAQRIIQAHHGTITAESEGEDKGSTFIITLPARQEI